MLAGCGSFAKSNEPKGSISNITDKISKSETKSEEEQEPEEQKAEEQKVDGRIKLRRQVSI